MNKKTKKILIIGFSVFTVLSVILILFTCYTLKKVGETAPYVLLGLTKKFTGVDFSADKETTSQQLGNFLINYEMNEKLPETSGGTQRNPK